MTHDYLRQPIMMQLKEEDIIGQKCEEAAISGPGFGIEKSMLWKQNDWLCNEQLTGYPPN